MPVDTPTTPKLTRAESARRNGGKSRGPKTPEGKTISSQNGIKLGMYSSRVVLRNESQEIYGRLKDHYIQRWQPTDVFEFELVETMVNCRWRIRRLEATETANMDLALLEHRAEFEAKFGNLDPRAEQALSYRALAATAVSPERISRHEERLHRQFERAFRTLATSRQKSPRPTPPESPKPEPQPPVKPGFLSRLSALLVTIFAFFESFNFPAGLIREQHGNTPPKPRKDENNPAENLRGYSPDALLRLLDRHPEIRTALIQALHEDRG